MSDLILSLPHYQTYNDLRSADNKHAFRTSSYVSFYRICILYCCTLWFLTSCLNAHNHTTCIRLPQTRCTARKMALFIISQDCQTQVLAANAMATTVIID